MRTEILEFLEEFDVKFEWINKKTLGLYKPEEEEIIINIYLLIMETLLHEYLHHKYPNLGENEIELLTQAKVQTISVNDIKEIVNTAIGLRR
jgi:hypothetical protein